MTDSSDTEDTAEAPLSLRLREGTRTLHVTAERTGIMAKLLRGNVDRPGYCRLLRSLREIYLSLETGLEANAANPCVNAIYWPELNRTPAIERDLADICGEDWPDLPPAGAARTYVERIQALAQAEPCLLVAHAYLRYLGDLSGGQILKRIVRSMLELPDGSGGTFYDFGRAGSPEELKARYRQRLDAIRQPAMFQAIVDEANEGLRQHIALFEELDRAD